MTHEPHSALLTAALEAAARGWAVFPLRPGAKRAALHHQTHCPRTGPCWDGHAKPEQRATTDPERIARCWANGPFNVGVATGPSGLVVVDLDKPKGNGDVDMPDGMTNLLALCERAGQQLPATHTVRTASGGWHMYFTARAGARLGNTAGRLGPLIDTRAWGGHVVAAGSVVNGSAYITSDATPVVALPGWLHAKLTEPTSLPAAPSPAAAGDTGAVHSLPAYVRAALMAEEANVRSAREGTRNATLLRAARALGRFVSSGDLAHAVAFAALQVAGETAGMSSSECTATINSAFRWTATHDNRRTA